jgi:hypothetical protein
VSEIDVYRVRINSHETRSSLDEIDTNADEIGMTFVRIDTNSDEVGIEFYSVTCKTATILEKSCLYYLKTGHFYF